MKYISVFLMLFWMVLGITGCMSVTPSDLLGIWKIDKFTVDGMDRTRVAFNRSGLNDPIDWGNAIQFLSDGSYQTNLGQQGQWKLTKGRTHVLLFSSETADPVRWKLSVGDQYLVLETSTKKILFSRTDRLPPGPKPTPPNLLANLPGTWYFYQWHDREDTLHYPSTEKQARWLTLDWDGAYRSGEGYHQSFRGRWQLQEDTLMLSESERALRQAWHIRLSEDTLFVEPATDTTDWFQALLVRTE